MEIDDVLVQKSLEKLVEARENLREAKRVFLEAQSLFAQKKVAEGWVEVHVPTTFSYGEVYTGIGYLLPPGSVPPEDIQWYWSPEDNGLDAELCCELRLDP
jgi:hypothetical protein